MEPTSLEPLLALLAGDAAPIDPLRVVVTLGMTFLIGLWIAFVYRFTLRGALFSRHFAIALVGASLVTGLVIIPISSNITLSLGMVGALSIVRFRAAIKDPIDIIFLFWAIAVGIASGAGFHVVSVLGSGLIGVMLLSLGAIPWTQRTRYVLVVRYAQEAEAAVKLALPPHRLRSRAVDSEGVELVAEVHLKDTENLPETLVSIEGVSDAQLVSAALDG